MLNKGERRVLIILIPFRHIDSTSGYESVRLLVECVNSNLDMVLLIVSIGRAAALIILANLARVKFD